MNRILSRGVALLLAAAVTAMADPFAVDLSAGPVGITLRAEPAAVEIDGDLLVTLTVEAPEGLDVRVPDLRDRFSGFVSAEGFADEPSLANGRRSVVHRWRLVPAPARTYRLAPFAVEVRDTRVIPPAVSFLATRPVVFPGKPLDVSAEGDVEIDPRPKWIAPTRRAVAWGIAAVVAAAAAVAGLVFGLTRIRRKVRELRLSPAQRAFAELERLLKRRLPEQGFYKDFYIELTQVVRRYIERSHGIRAPEQTTEEFLTAAGRHPRFTPAVLLSLREFLQSADLVKFAGQESNPHLADRAVATARDYVTRDAAEKNEGLVISAIADNR